MPEQSCTQRLQYVSGLLSSSLDSARSSFLVRVLLCLFVILQPCGFSIHGQEQNQYQTYLAAITNPNDPYHAYALGQITEVLMSPQETLSVVPPLMSATRESNRSNRRSARYSLQVLQGRIAQRGVSVVPDVIELLKEDDTKVCQWAAGVLLQIGEVAIPDLREALKDRDDQVQLYAMLVLGRFSEKAKSALPELQRIFESDSRRHVKIDAAIAIAEIASDTSTIPILREGLQDKYPVRVSRSADALARLGVSGRDLYPQLIPVLKNENPAARGSAALALARIDAPREKVAYELISALNSEKRHYFDYINQFNSLNPDKEPDKTDDKFEAIQASARSRQSMANALITFCVPIKMWRQQLIDLIQEVPVRLTKEDNDYLPIDLGTEITDRLSHLGSSAVPDLVSILSEERAVQVRRSVLRILKEIGLGAKEALPLLIAAIKDPNYEDIREEVVIALGSIGPTAPEQSLPALTETVGSHVLGLGVHRSAAISIKNIAHRLEDREATDYIALLEQAHQSMVSDDIIVKESAADVARSIKHLRGIWWRELSPAWVRTHKKYVALAAIPPVLLLLWLTILWLRPLWLLKINQSLANVSDVRLPSWLGGVTLSTRWVLLVGFFQYHSRVLDAWVAARAVNVRKVFDEKSTVREHGVHVPIPISLNGTLLSDAGAANLSQVFAGEVNCLLIKGDGGTGKTSFACLIAHWAISTRREVRLCPFIMLPVLIEPEATAQFDSEDAILKFVQTQLRLLAQEAEPPDLDLVKNLLRRNRILLVVDSLSEMNAEARAVISASIASLPVNASLVTSRNDELLNGMTKDVVVMSRIEGNYLSDFLGSYLTHLHKRQLFNDEEFFEACRRLTLMAGGRDITVLLAKLYADHMVMSKECNFHEDAPQNVPELFLQYVNRVNRLAAVDVFNDTTVQQGAKLVAWECLKDHFIPTTIKRESIFSSLGGETVGLPLIRHLEEKLKIVRTVGVQRDRLRFTLDPLAEYLACLYIVDTYEDDESKWLPLLHSLRVSRVNDIRFFLLALQDCCTVMGDGQVPAGMVEKLSKLSGWDHGEERQKQRKALVDQLTKDLKMLDPEELNEVQRNLSLTQNFIPLSL